MSGPLLVLSSREKCFLFRVWNEGRLESELCLETTANDAPSPWVHHVNEVILGASDTDLSRSSGRVRAKKFRMCNEIDLGSIHVKIKFM